MAVAHMILSIGNSHDEGRASAIAGDTFPDKVWQWTQQHGGTAPYLVQVTDPNWPKSTAMPQSKAVLDHIDSQAGQFSPDVTFANDYLANNAVDRLVFVPNANGSTAFFSSPSSNNWNADDAPGNLLDGAVARFKKAHDYLMAQGFTVVVAGVLFHVANPDYGMADNVQNPGWDIHRETIDQFVTYLRDNLEGISATTPIAIGGGMNQYELLHRPDQNDRLYQANLLGAAARSNNVGSFDPINPRYGYSTGLPVHQIKESEPNPNQHANRAGDITLGHLRYQALVRARSNANCRAPFSNLPFFSPATITALWDFRTGSPVDVSGNANHLKRYDDTNPPLYLVDVKVGATPALDQLAWKRASGVTRQVHQVPMPLPPQYTIAVYLKMDSLAGPMAFLQRADAPDPANQHRFQYLSAPNEVRAGHGSATNTVSFSGSLLNTTAYHLLTLTFDGTTMRLYLDGALKSSHVSAGHSSLADSYLGAASASAGNPLVGTMAFAMVCNRALTSTEVGQLWSTAQSLLAP